MEKNTAIEVRNVSKKFKSEMDVPKALKDRIVFWGRGKTSYHQVLSDISFDIKKGETVAIIGSNGSGKSTLLKLIAKIIYPNQGTIEVNGKVASLLELGAGFHPDFTGRENIYFNAAIFGLSQNQINAKLNDIIEFSELQDFIDTPVRTYSSGMYMRLAFSIAINVDADILLIDEILAVGDQHFQMKCNRKLEELRSTKTIIMVSHNLASVKNLCKRSIWIYHGKLKLDGDSSYVIDQYFKQIDFDHKDKEKSSATDASQKAIVYIQTPTQFSRIKSGIAQILIAGWVVYTDEKFTLELSIDGKPVNFTKRYARQDVYLEYCETYPKSKNDDIGWEAEVKVSDISKGNHTLSAEVLDSNNVVASHSVTFEVE